MLNYGEAYRDPGRIFVVSDGAKEWLNTGFALKR
jgi:hypothetical protein